MRPNFVMCMSMMVCLLIAMVAAPVLADKDKEAEKRAKVDAMAEETLTELFESSADAKELYGKAVGHAVFSNMKVQLGISGGGGKGVAVSKSGERTYMKMGTGGVGFGIGAQKYHVIFLFQTEKSFDSFVNKGWQADASAQAAAGEAATGAAASFKNGIAYYQITDQGLIASADLTGTKYWKDGDLNEKKPEKEPKPEGEKKE